MRSLGVFVFVAIMVACESGTHPQASSVPPNQPQCDYVNYHHDESVNLQGPGKCTTDCDCDGMRLCKTGACTGAARPEGTEHCNDASYRWNEAWNGGGSGNCANDCECDSTRTCVTGHCQSGPPPKPGDTTFTR